MGTKGGCPSIAFEGGLVLVYCERKRMRAHLCVRFCFVKMESRKIGIGRQLSDFRG